MALHFEHQTEAAIQLAFSLIHLEPDAIVQYLENLGDQIVDGHEGLGVSRAEAFGLARRFCTVTLDHVIQMRNDPQWMH